MTDTAQALEDTEENRPSRGRPRDAEKNSAILAAAGELFLERGFDATSMDEVARHAKVSKQTVYSHFSSKEQLFSAAIHQKIEAHFPDTVLSRIATHTLEDDLMLVAGTYARLLLSPEAMAVHRIMVVAAPKNPELGRIFWAAGPEEMTLKLRKFLKSWADKGALTIPDLDYAAGLLISLLKGKQHFYLSIGLIQAVAEDDMNGHIRRTVDTFLRLYRA